MAHFTDSDLMSEKKPFPLFEMINFEPNSEHLQSLVQCKVCTTEKYLETKQFYGLEKLLKFLVNMLKIMELLYYEPLNRYETNLFNLYLEACDFLDQLSTDGVTLLADLFHMNIEKILPMSLYRDIAILGMFILLTATEDPLEMVTLT